MKGFISQDKYKEILEHVPIPCVDIVLKHRNEFLMIKRTNPPMQGQWWLPGGRIFKGETMEQAAYRKLKEETNIETARIAKKLGPYETIFPDGPFGIKTGVHSINVVFLMETDDVSKLKHDKNHSDQRWFSEVDKDWHPYIKQVLADCRF